VDALKDFEVAEENPFDLATLRNSVQYIISKRDFLNEELLNLLVTLHPTYEEEEIDLPALVKSQLRSAIALKNSYFNHKTGRLLDGNTAREAKDALASVQQVLNTLIKQQESLDHQARLLKMENILIHCAEDLPEEVRAKFLDEVARQLGE